MKFENTEVWGVNMFEEEAEEAGNEKIKGNHQFARCARKSYKDGFKDGAEFGYNKANEELEEKIKVTKLEIIELKSQIKKMKRDVIFLIKDRMNDDIDQNIIERLAEKWEIKEK